MKYTEVKIAVKEQFLKEILIAELVDLGYDSFQEEEEQLLAFVVSETYDEAKVCELLARYQSMGVCSFIEAKPMPIKNWNEEWESNFDPVEIAGRIRIRAPFHESKPDFEHEILLMPKMAFGTGHHATTFQMLEQMLDFDFTDLSVLDYGCGTAVLALMAERLGAKEIFANDIDEWAVNNAKEILNDNKCTKVVVEKGEKDLFQNMRFDVVLANINKNVLLDSKPDLAKVLQAGGRLMMSGIFETDVEEMLDFYADTFQHLKTVQKDNWAVIHFNKK